MDPAQRSMTESVESCRGIGSRAERVQAAVAANCTGHLRFAPCFSDRLERSEHPSAMAFPISLRRASVASATFALAANRAVPTLELVATAAGEAWWTTN